MCKHRSLEISLKPLDASRSVTSIGLLAKSCGGACEFVCVFRDEVLRGELDFGKEVGGF